jgi:hypothetical protein
MMLSAAPRGGREGVVRCDELREALGQARREAVPFSRLADQAAEDRWYLIVACVDRGVALPRREPLPQ